MANDAAKVSAIMAGVGLESLLNPTALRLRQVAKQPKYNGNPRRWPQFQRKFKLWVKTQKLQEDKFLTPVCPSQLSNYLMVFELGAAPDDPSHASSQYLQTVFTRVLCDALACCCTPPPLPNSSRSPLGRSLRA